jgi:hypothetical protein
MNPAHDPIRGLESLGYTERESSFLYLVALHSGYFVRRQFLSFIHREDGAIAQHFFQKVSNLRHVRSIAYQQERHIYHLKAKSIYGLLGQPDSQNRRNKGDRQIKARLMQLDYVIEHFGQTFLETEEQKVEFFHRELGVPIDVLPWSPICTGQGLHFARSVPNISTDSGQPKALRCPHIYRRWYADGIRLCALAGPKNRSAMDLVGSKGCVRLGCSTELCAG